MIPRISVITTTFCEMDGEAEGRTLSIRWGRWLFEIALGRFAK